jgi:hypothetical protein
MAENKFPSGLGSIIYNILSWKRFALLMKSFLLKFSNIKLPWKRIIQNT